MKPLPFIRSLVSAVIVAVSCLSLTAADTAGVATLEFTTVNPNGKHQPKNILAVWVTDAKTNFVQTVLKQAGKRQRYLFTWNQQRNTNAVVDGVTGATLPTHAPRTASWNCRDYKGKTAADGNYLLFVEFTDAHVQGPLAVFPFSKGTYAQTLSFPDRDLLKNIQLKYQPAH